MKLYFFARILIITGLGLTILACNYNTSPALRVGMNNWIGYAPAYLSYSHHSSNNTPYQVIPLGSATDVMHGLRGGTLEAGALTLDEAITLAGEGIELDIVLVFDVSNGGDALLSKKNESIKELKGKRVAVENTAVGALLLSGALLKAQLSLQDITVINCPYHQHERCFREADALVTFEPLLSNLKQQGAQVLFSSKEIPKQIIDVLVVRRETNAEHRESLQAFINHYFVKLEDLHRAESQELSVLADFTQLTPEELKRAFRGIKFASVEENLFFLRGGKGAKLAQQQEQLRAFLLEHAYMSNEHYTPIRIDSSYVQELR